MSRRRGAQMSRRRGAQMSRAMRDRREPAPWRRLFRRRPWEMLATAMIGAGVVMLMQPVLLVLYSYSLVTTLAGVVLFTIVSKFPD
jgi:hypothetical protein